MVPEERLELSLPREHDFESCASTSSATPATAKQYHRISVETRDRVSLRNGRFATDYES